jgi:hypothetical protein
VEPLEDKHPATAITTTIVTPDQPSRRIAVQLDARRWRYKLSLAGEAFSSHAGHRELRPGAHCAAWRTPQ